MKKMLIQVLVLVMPVASVAQTSYEDFIKRIPALPKDSCNITRDKMNAFTGSVELLINDVRYRQDEINRAAKSGEQANEAASKDEAARMLAQQYGMSEEEIAKMKSGNMSQADKQAMASRMMQQQTNMSMAEAKNFQNMNDAGKQAYAQAYGTEAMAAQQASGAKPGAAPQGGDMYKLVTEQQAVMARIDAAAQKIGVPYAEIVNDPSAQQSLDRISSWHSQLTAMMGVDAGQGRKMDSLQVLIINEQVKYCDRFTPKYRAALRNHLQVFKSSVPDMYRLGQITAEMSKSSTGLAPPAGSVEAGILESLQEYLSKLREAYKYKLNYAEEN